MNGDKGIQPAGSGAAAVRLRSVPQARPGRAEEFGDVLAERIYWLLDQGGSVTDADRPRWAKFLVKRRTSSGAC
jgi:hypothetical protein